MAKVGNRQKKTWKCSKCGAQNYRSEKNGVNTPERKELKKYCPFCREHTIHKEMK